MTSPEDTPELNTTRTNNTVGISVQAGGNTFCTLPPNPPSPRQLATVDTYLTFPSPPHGTHVPCGATTSVRADAPTTFYTAYEGSRDGEYHPPV